MYLVGDLGRRVEAVAFARSGVEIRRARRLEIMGEFRNSDDGILFGKVCLVFLQRIRALLDVVVE